MRRRVPVSFTAPAPSRCPPVAPPPTVLQLIFWRLDLRDRLPLPHSLFSRPDVPPLCHCRAPRPHRPDFSIPPASLSAPRPVGAALPPWCPRFPPRTLQKTPPRFLPLPKKTTKNERRRRKTTQNDPNGPKSGTKMGQKGPYYRESIGFCKRRLKPLEFG